MLELPIDSHLPRLLEALGASGAAVLTAEPGAGKTTRVPPALAGADFAKGSQVWVLEPRRIAALMAAWRVAEEKGEEPGQSIGYHFRFERAESDKTRVLFLTEGMFLKRLQGNPKLDGVAAVVLDEFHERSLDADLALALLTRLRKESRPDLKLVVMSATLDTQAVAEFLDKAPAIHCPGRIFPVTVKYMDQGRSDTDEPLEKRVRRAIRELAQDSGDVLVFLPGAAEIRRTEGLLKGEMEVGPITVLPLHGSLSPQEQRRVLGPAPTRKVILSTSVAETSLTVPGVRVVVDSGLARRDAFNPWNGLSSLVTLPASKASMTQRAGRAGREAPGFCIRLGSLPEFNQRLDYDQSEIARADLSGAMLEALAAGFPPLNELAWLEAPEPGHLEAARLLLAELGATDASGALTPKGRAMARAPLHPRLAAAALDAAADSDDEIAELCKCLAQISEERARELDFWTALSRYQPQGQAARLVRQLAEWLKNERGRQKGGKSEWKERLGLALLGVFPDQVAFARSGSDKRGECRFVLCGGGEAQSRDETAHIKAGYYLLLEILDQKGLGGKGGTPKVLTLMPLAEDWLLERLPHRLREEVAVSWDAQAKRVRRESKLLYGKLVISQGIAKDELARKKGAELLLAEARKAGLKAFCPEDQPARYLARREFAMQVPGCPALPGEEEIWAEVELAGETSDSLEEIRAADPLKLALDRAGHEARAYLEARAPRSIRLSSGREASVRYEQGKAPYLSARIQDFFGTRECPRLNGIALTVHLLAPNQRSLQVTSDLAGFWEREYPRIRPGLSRKYPRHAWPDNPIKPK